MSTSYERVELGEAGCVYVRECLANGRSLSYELAKSLKIEAGRAVTFLPEAPTRLSVETLRRGGVASRLLSIAAIEDTIRREMSGSDILIGENPLANCNDAYVRAHPEGVACYRDEVYHLGWLNGVDDLAIAGVLRRSSAAPSGEVHAITSGKAGLSDSAWPRRIPDLAPLARGTKAIAVGAFDGEGYVFWRPAASNDQPSVT